MPTQCVACSREVEPDLVIPCCLEHGPFVDAALAMLKPEALTAVAFGFSQERLTALRNGRTLVRALVTALARMSDADYPEEYVRGVNAYLARLSEVPAPPPRTPAGN